jgi:hypothetical protein
MPRNEYIEDMYRKEAYFFRKCAVLFFALCIGLAIAVVIMATNWPTTTINTQSISKE